MLTEYSAAELRVYEKGRNAMHTFPKKSLMTTAIGCVMTFGISANAEIYLVDGENGDDDTTGGALDDGWNQAYKTLQKAIDVADGDPQDPDEIWVKGSDFGGLRYYPDEGPGVTPGDPEATFELQDNVEIYGGFEGDEQTLQERDPGDYETILSGDLNGDDNVIVNTDSQGNFTGLTFQNYADNSYHVVTAEDVDSSAVLDSVTVRGGRDQAIVLDESSARIIDCVIKENKTSDEDGSNVESTAGIYEPVLRECQFIRNESNERAVRVLRGRAIMIDCTYGPVAAESTGRSL